MTRPSSSFLTELQTQVKPNSGSSVIRQLLPYLTLAAVLHGGLLAALHGEWLSQQPDAPAALQISLTEAAPAPAPDVAQAATQAAKIRTVCEVSSGWRFTAPRCDPRPAQPVITDAVIAAEPVLPLADSSLIPALFAVSATPASTDDAHKISAGNGNAAEAQGVSAADDAPRLSTTQIIAPPSVTMQMRIVRETPGQNPMYGVGEVRWQHDSQHYRLELNAGLDLLLTSVTLYQSVSEGQITQAALQPRILSEKRRGRSETATHFDRSGATVTFSSSNKTLALHSGAQDRASVLLQLAALGKADPGWFQAGRRFRIQVAEDRDAMDFVFEVVEETTLKTSAGTYRCWHLRRPPLAGKYNSALDIWLAPDLHCCRCKSAIQKAMAQSRHKPCAVRNGVHPHEKNIDTQFAESDAAGQCSGKRCRNGRIFTGTVCRIALHD
jgi:hypothetical protein